MYNFENYLTHPMISTFVGLILFLGIVSLGYFIINFLLNDFVTTDKKFYLNSPLIGTLIFYWSYLPL